MGIGDWGLGIGDWAQSPIPNPQSPFEIQIRIKFVYYLYAEYYLYLYLCITLYYISFHNKQTMIDTTNNKSSSKKIIDSTFQIEQTLNTLYPDGSDPNQPIVIYTDGVFDCFHYGHARLLKRIKGMFKHVKLIVGVSKDEDVTREKKAEPLFNENERMEAITHCKYADEVILGPWLPTFEHVDSIGAHYILHDPEPYPYPYGDIKDVYGSFKEVNRFLISSRTEGISTTDIIVKILRNYDVYKERCIKKGIDLK